MSDKPEITRRFVANRESQQGTGNLAGLEFGQDKWKYPYEAAVEHPGEFIRRTEGGYGVTQSTAEAVYGTPNRDSWADGPVQKVMKMFFGEEGFGRGTGAGTRYTAFPTQDDFRKNSPPLPVFTKYTLVGGLAGAVHAMMFRYTLRVPMYAALHRSIFTVTFYAWMGYQTQKFITMKNLGQYKMAIDYAEAHSDIIYKQEPSKFGDPEILEHYVKMGGKGHTG